MGNLRDKYIYAMYKGDKIVDVGTKKELMDRHGYTLKTISWYMTSNKIKERAEKGSVLGFYKVCKIEDMNKDDKYYEEV